MSKKRPGVPYAKGRKFCIFCGAPADSEEHIWPKWAHHILPRSTGHRRFAYSGSRGVPTRISLDYRRQGAVATVRLKRVCQSCNTGWMSRYEERLKWHLERIFEGKRTFLNASAQIQLAEYLTYKMMVADFIDNDPIIPPDQPQAFYRSRTIPPHTNIWVFTCSEGSWRSALRTESVGLFDLDKPIDKLEKNTKSFSVGFGSLFALAIFSQNNLELEFQGTAAFRLWPPTSTMLTWPLRNTIDSEEAQFISECLVGLKNNLTVIKP